MRQAVPAGDDDDPQAITCDICGSEKKQTNHWFVAYEQGGELRVSGWNSRNQLRAASKHLCGQTCLHKLVDDFMARTLSVRPQLAGSDEAVSSRPPSTFQSRCRLRFNPSPSPESRFPLQSTSWHKQRPTFPPPGRPCSFHLRSHRHRHQPHGRRSLSGPCSPRKLPLRKLGLRRV